jgi:ribosomal protein S15P/S13E
MEGYTTEEVVECCADYVKDGKRIDLPIPLHECRLRGRMCQKSFVDRDCNSVSETHFSVLQQLEIAATYIEEHLSELHRDNNSRTETWIMKEHRHVFTTWLMDKDIPTEDMTMKMLAYHPLRCVTT